jgi:acetyl-CoA synthetase
MSRLYMPMIPELAIGLLARAHRRATHRHLRRLQPRRYVIVSTTPGQSLCTADGGWRRGSVVPLKDDRRAVAECPTIEHVLVAQRLPQERQVTMQAGRDVWLHDALANVSKRTSSRSPR